MLQDVRRCPQDTPRQQGFLQYDQATSPTRQFMLEATTDGSLATSEEVQQAIDLMNEVSPELAENDFDVESTDHGDGSNLGY